MMLRLAGMACALLVLQACATRPPPPVASFADGVVTYSGVLVAGSLGVLQSAAGGRPVTRLRIASDGGDVIGSIKMARWIHDNGIDVEVNGPCFSSCANYIFPAGRNKYIAGAGLVGWHGTLEHLLYKVEQGQLNFSAADVKSLREVVAQERSFYADTGINRFTGWFGKVEPYNVFNLYFLSKDDMEYFGIDRLHVPADYAKSDLSRYHKIDPRMVQLLAVDRAVTNASDPRWGSSVRPAPGR